jgi:hypothetical protein
MSIFFFSNSYKRKVNKKADMTVSTLIKLVLALVVLVIIVMIVWNYATRAGKNMQGTSDNIGKDTSISNGYCAVIGIRKCCDSSESGWKVIDDSKTDYNDCKSGQKCCVNSGAS